MRFLNERAKQQVVSFDFDGTLHVDVHNGNPIDYWNDNPTPNPEIINKLREEAKTAKIVIVSARHDDALPVVKAFVKRHSLPIDGIYFTGLESKLPILKKLDVVRHYDDLVDYIKGLEEAGIKHVLVVPDVTKASS